MTPAWFVPELILQANMYVVVLDDDSSIHQIWDGRFKEDLGKKLNLKILHFSLEEEIVNWLREQFGSVFIRIGYTVQSFKLL